MYSWRKLLINSYIFIYKRKIHNLFKYKNLKLVEYALIINKFPNDGHSDNFRSQILVREKNNHHHVASSRRRIEKEKENLDVGGKRLDCAGCKLNRSTGSIVW